MTALGFVDTETTGLDPGRHEVWEIAVIVRGHRLPDLDGEWLWQVRPDLRAADPDGLRISRYYAREQLHGVRAARLASPEGQGPDAYAAVHPRMVAEEVAVLLDGAHMVGAVPSFDAAFLSRFLRRHGQAPTWHYHLVDVEALAAGFLAAAGEPIASPPWRSDDLSSALGVEAATAADRHTALGDARWAMRLYDRVLGDAV